MIVFSGSGRDQAERAGLKSNERNLEEGSSGDWLRFRGQEDRKGSGGGKKEGEPGRYKAINSE